MQQQYPSRRPSPAHSASNTSSPQRGQHPAWHTSIPQFPQGAQGVIQLFIPLFGGSSPATLPETFLSPNQTPWSRAAPVPPPANDPYTEHLPPIPNRNPAEREQVNAPRPAPPAHRIYANPLPSQSEEIRPPVTANFHNLPMTAGPPQHVGSRGIQYEEPRPMERPSPRFYPAQPRAPSPVIPAPAPRSNAIDVTVDPRTDPTQFHWSAFDHHVKDLRLICHELPWPIFIHEESGVITWQRIRQEIYDALQADMTDAEWELAPREKRREIRSYQRAAGREAGIPRRVDWLEDKTKWVNFTQDISGTMKRLMPGRAPIYENWIIVLDIIILEWSLEQLAPYDEPDVSFRCTSMFIGNNSR